MIWIIIDIDLHDYSFHKMYKRLMAFRIFHVSVKKKKIMNKEMVKYGKYLDPSQPELRLFGETNGWAPNSLNLKLVQTYPRRLIAFL